LIKTKEDMQFITQETQMTFDDMIFFAYFPLQFFQILVIGPDQKAYVYILKNFQALLAFDYDLYFKVNFEFFWRIFILNTTIVLIWILFSLIYLLKIDYRFSNFFSSLGFNRILRNCIPITGNIGFMPLISMLMNIYLCINGISDDLYDSYLYQDCTTMCYKGKHVFYIILTTIILSIFIIISSLTRPYWERTSQFLNLRTSYLYSSILSFAQVLLIVFNKALKTNDQIAHGIACLIILVMLFIVTIILKPYNYQRAFLSQVISLVAAIWGVGTSTFFMKYSNLTIWAVVEFSGFVLILFIGIYLISHSPKLLKSESGVNIGSLFLFQFCKDYEEFTGTYGDFRIPVSSQAYIIGSESDK
jgi:hypothetical protein